MRKICKHAYPSDLCGTCNPPAKEEADDRLALTACSPSATLETDAAWAKHRGTTPDCWLEFVNLASKLERERNNAIREIVHLRSEIRETLMENLHLADGDNCTLKRLKDAIDFDLDSPENDLAFNHHKTTKPKQ